MRVDMFGVLRVEGAVMLSYDSTYTCTSLHPTSTQYTAFYTAEPRCAHACAHTYAHTAKRSLDPTGLHPPFGAQRREGVAQFAHAAHTTTTTSAITLTKSLCAASSAYQMQHYTCV